jgi:hypothetical protein
MKVLNKLNDFTLKFWVDGQLANSNLKLGKRANYVRFGLVLLMLFGTPLFAAPSATNNVVTRFVWWLTQMAFYGTGAAVVLLGIIFPVAKKVLSGQRSETNPVVNILWAVGLFAAPSLLQLGHAWFNANEGSAGMLNDMQIHLGDGE